MKVGVIGAGTMGQGIAKAFAQVDGYTVALCDIKQEWAEGGKDKIAKGYARLVEKGKMTQEAITSSDAEFSSARRRHSWMFRNPILEADGFPSVRLEKEFKSPADRRRQRSLSRR